MRFDQLDELLVTLDRLKFDVASKGGNWAATTGGRIKKLAAVKAVDASISLLEQAHHVLDALPELVTAEQVEAIAKAKAQKRALAEAERMASIQEVEKEDETDDLEE